MHTYNFRALLLLILATVTFSACEKVDKAQNTRSAKGDVSLGGALNVAIPKSVTLLNPNELTDAISSEIGLHLHGCLVSLDPKTLEVIPSIAESWAVDENGTSYVFKLRKGVKFHKDECFGNSSRDVTAKDFVFSFQKLCASSSKAYETTFANRVQGAAEFHDGSTQTVAGIQAIDDFTLRVQLIKPDPSFLFVLAQPATGVVSETALAEYGDENVIGAGPFILASKKEDLILVRNPDYFHQDSYGNKFPYLDTLCFKMVATKEDQLQAFFEGQVDLVSGLYLDPVRSILETHMERFSGDDPMYIMERESESVGFETYSIYRSNLKGFGSNFMGYRDFLRVQVEQ
jgi:oligopeptide transport system substrate-binding protein